VKATGATKTIAQPGAVFTLDLRDSTDPDGDKLSFKFWQDGDQDSVRASVPIAHDGSGRATIVVPNGPGTQLQIIGEVTDDGDPALTTYQRYLIDRQQPCAGRRVIGAGWNRQAAVLRSLGELPRVVVDRLLQRRRRVGGERPPGQPLDPRALHGSSRRSSTSKGPLAALCPPRCH
jgi:hypothetical protein